MNTDLLRNDMPVEALGLDSLDLLLLAQKLEVELGVQISDDALPEMSTVGDIARYIQQEVSGEEKRRPETP